MPQSPGSIASDESELDYEDRSETVISSTTNRPTVAFDVELSTFARKYGVIAKMFPPENRVLRLAMPNPPPISLSGSRYASKSAE
ncbi:hypothetical protein AZE42_01215 [Rhizopogon vesiculosus]|uniref:Uncharacterized protein n=1 Tax=Rhizopogon vesiculosus TaxID=180088 RepID=A0A1J8QVV6_9AGAM|nr:hypothetical protein AZE42_01215 [Rhizopogon vesiculosus]